MRQKLRPQRKQQRGFVLLTILIALIAWSLILTSIATERSNASLELRGKSLGKGLGMVNNAMGTFQGKYYDPIAQGTAIPGVADPKHPTLPELSQWAGLAGIYSNGLIGGAQVINEVALTPAGCAPGDCNMVSISRLAEPVATIFGKPDYRKLMAAALAIGGDAGFSDGKNPDVIALGNGATIPNPDPAKRAGILVAINGYGSSAWGAFVRINDTRDPDLKGNLTIAGDTNLNSDLTVAGTTTTNDATVNNNLNLLALGNPGQACSPVGAVRRNMETGTSLVVCFNGTWQTVGTAVNNVGENVACSRPGQIATNPGNQAFICRNGYYVSITNLMPKNVELARYVAGDNNVTVPKPTCAAGGSPSFSFEARTMGTDFSQAPPYTAVRYSADDYGWAWVPRILLVNMNGAVQSGNVLGLQGVFKAECYYP